MEWLSCKRILDDAVAMGVKEVAFSGGEPLLWKHIQDAVERTSTHGMKVTIYSTGNAPYAQKIISDLLTTGLDRAIFSLFGGNAHQHEKVTACKGSYGKTLKIVRHCLNIGLETEFHFVPFSYNYRILPDIVEQARRLGVKRVSLLRLVPQGRASKEKDGHLTHSQNLELHKIVKKLRDDGHDIRLGSPYNFLMLREKPQCRSGIDRITVGPDLRIFPCDAFKHILPEEIGVSSKFSNLSEHSLQESWEKSPYLKKVREYLTTDIATECKNCEKYRACLSGCVAQKFYAYNELRKCPDPMCLLGMITRFADTQLSWGKRKKTGRMLLMS